MPVYEYRCSGCRRKISIFFRSMTSTDAPRCSNCGSTDLERLFSRVAVRRASGRAASSGYDNDTLGQDTGIADGWTGDDFGGMNGNPYGGDMYGGEGNPFGLSDDTDPGEMARWTRQMSAQMGEPLDQDLDQALTDIERGADPEEALDRLDDSSFPDAE